MNTVRLGIVGAGNMGLAHAGFIQQGKVTRVALTAVLDKDPARLEKLPHVRPFTDQTEFLNSGVVDAILVATPHYLHTPITLAAFQAGVHVLVEKPLAVHKADCQRLITAYKRTRKLVFAEMFNQRTDPYYIKIREMVRGGELGEVRRVNWTVTDWFRTAAYYASSDWRATWAGEGGGVLLNQCPHQIDIYQWIFGLPARVRAACSLGRYHNIEVEDDVTAFFEYDSGLTAVFTTSTGEFPGTNRIEITGEKGRLVYEKDQLTFRKNAVPMTQFNRETPEVWGTPANTELSIPVAGHGPQHVGIIQNFVDAILEGTPLIAPAVEGIHSVELANAMLYSSVHQKTVKLPLSAAAYKRTLESLIQNSRQQPPGATPPNPRPASQ